MVIENNYPETVQEIHKAYFSAGDRNLAEAEAIIEKCTQQYTNKGQSLMNIGFSNVAETKQLAEMKAERNRSLEISNQITGYLREFPGYKFISFNDVKTINDKYKLVRGTIDRFTGFVPSKNLADIQRFIDNFDKPNDYDQKMGLTQRYHVQSIELSYTTRETQRAAVINYFHTNPEIMLKRSRVYGHDEIKRHVFELIQSELKLQVNVQTVNTRKLPIFEICAPASDMMSAEKSRGLLGLFKAKVTVDPDPIVLYPVKHGYIIVTAWGDEASDPLVLNEQMN